jgi:hypothetical protein
MVKRSPARSGIPIAPSRSGQPAGRSSAAGSSGRCRRSPRTPASSGSGAATCRCATARSALHLCRGGCAAVPGITWRRVGREFFGLTSTGHAGRSSGRRRLRPARSQACDVHPFAEPRARTHVGHGHAWASGAGGDPPQLSDEFFVTERACALLAHLRRHGPTAAGTRPAPSSSS